MSRSVEVLEEDVEYAYQVLDAVKRALDKVAVNPDNMEKFELELIKKMPAIFEAMLYLLPKEHQGIMYELFKSTGRYARTWMKEMLKKKKKQSETKR